MVHLTSSTSLARTCPRYACLKQRSCVLPSHSPAPLQASRRSLLGCQRRSNNLHQLQVNAVASVDKAASNDAISSGSVDIDNKSDKKYSTVLVKAPHRSGLLTSLTDILSQSGLDICKASVDNSDGTSVNKFLVCGSDGGKLENKEQLSTLRQALESAVSPQTTGRLRPKLKNADKNVAEDKKNFLFTLMGTQIGMLSTSFSHLTHQNHAFFCRFLPRQRCS